MDIDSTDDILSNGVPDAHMLDTWLGLLQQINEVVATDAQQSCDTTGDETFGVVGHYQTQEETTSRVVGTQSDTSVNELILNDHMYFKVDNDIHTDTERSVAAFELVEDSNASIPTSSDGTSVCSNNLESAEILNSDAIENGDELLDLSNVDLFDLTASIEQLIDMTIPPVGSTQPGPLEFMANRPSVSEERNKLSVDDGQHTGSVRDIEQYFAPSPSSSFGSMSPSSSFQDYMSNNHGSECSSPFAEPMYGSIADADEEFSSSWLENFTLFPSLV